MIHVPANAVEQTLIAFARQWFKLMAANRSEEACSLIDEPNTYGTTWTVERINAVVADTFPPGSRFHSMHPEGLCWTDPDALGEGGRPEVYRYDDGSGFGCDHGVPLCGEWSDLTAQFQFHRRSDGYAVVLHDLHVL